MTTEQNTAPAPTRAQAEEAVSAMLDVASGRENLVTRLKVARYASWRVRFDGMRGPRAAAGIANARLFRGSEDTVAVLADVPGFRDALACALDTGDLEMARWLEGAGLLMMGLASHGVGFKFDLGVTVSG